MKKKCINCGVLNLTSSNFCNNCGSRMNIVNPEELIGEDVFSFDNTIKIDTDINNDGDTLTIRLFKILSIVNNFKFKDRVYDNVKINWFVVEREKPIIPYEKVIMLYSRMSGIEKTNIAQYIDEKFTLREGRLLEKYIENTPDIKTIFEDIHIPIIENVRSFANIIGAMNTSRITLYKKKDYNLPFKVEGIFNITDAEESVSWDSKDTVISKNIRKELEEYKRNIEN